MEIQENRNWRKNLRAKSESEDPITTKRGEKEDLKAICNAVKKLTEAFGRVDRYGHDVPCIRPVRELCGKIKPQLNNEYGTFNRTLVSIREKNVLGHRKILESAANLRNFVNSISSDESGYIKRVEDIEQCLGELMGTVETVLYLEYQDV